MGNNLYNSFNNFKNKKSKLIMTLLVRDEVDVVDINIRFHLSRGVDFIIATDNGSVDGTRNILKKYEDEGILFLINEEKQDYSQAIWVNRMGRMAYEKYDADIIFHCDADEFWFPESGDLKKEIIKRESADVLRVNLVNVLLEENGGKEKFPEDNKWAVINPYKTHDLEKDSETRSLYLLEYPRKVLYKTKHGYLDATQGNHDIVTKEGLNIADSEDVTIFHYPIRSREHFFNKIRNGGSAYEENEKLGKNVGFHWRRWYEKYKKGTLGNEYRGLILTKKQAQELEKKSIVARHNFDELISK